MHRVKFHVLNVRSKLRIRGVRLVNIKGCSRLQIKEMCVKFYFYTGRYALSASTVIKEIY